MWYRTVTLDPSTTCAESAARLGCENSPRHARNIPTATMVALSRRGIRMTSSLIFLCALSLYGLFRFDHSTIFGSDITRVSCGEGVRPESFVILDILSLGSISILTRSALAAWSLLSRLA